MDEPLSESQARDILERWVRTTSWRRRGLAPKLQIVSFTSPGAHRVTFQSFTESRIVVPAHVPYLAGPVDGPENGPAPDPWSIQAPMPPLFTDLDQHFEMPHTARVEQCYRCRGSGHVKCHDCGGDGRVTCSSCSGSGSQTRTRTRTTTDANGQTHTETETYTETCWQCSGSGRVTCSTCHGSGQLTCPPCGGAGRLRHFQRLDVTWSNVVRVEVLEGTELPDDLLLDAEGRVALLEEDPMIERTAGIAGAGAFRGGLVRVNADVDRIANMLIEQHRFAEGTKLHRQRLTVHAVPVYRAEYRWGRNTRCFFVYGNESVHAPDYPISIVRVSALTSTFAAVAASAALLVSHERNRPVFEPYDAPVHEFAPGVSEPSSVVPDAQIAAWFLPDGVTSDASDVYASDASLHPDVLESPRVERSQGRGAHGRRR